MSKINILFLAKIVVSVLLLTYALSQVDMNELIKLERLSYSYLILAFLLLSVNIPIGTLRWQVLVWGGEIPLKYGRLFNLFTRGQFLGTFHPTGYVGDFYRGLAVKSEKVNRLTLLYSVFVDRLIGFLSLTLLCYGVSIFNQRELGFNISPEVHILVIIGVSSVFMFHPLAILFKKSMEPNKITRLLDLTSTFRISVIVTTLFLALLSNISMITSYYFIGLGLGESIPFKTFFILIPIVTVITFLPVSFSGLGLRELSAIYVFGLFAIDKAVSLKISLLYWILTMIIAALCGLSFFSSHQSDTV